MNPHESEVYPGHLEPPKEYLLTTSEYIDAVTLTLDQNPSKKTKEYFDEKLALAAGMGEVDDTLSRGRNVTALLKAASNLHISIPVTEQWVYYYKGHLKQAESLRQKGKIDMDAGEYYETLAEDAEKKAFSIQATFEEQGLSINEILSNPEDEFVDAVEAVAVRGEFPNGLRLKGKELCKPGTQGGFSNFSDSGFTLFNNFKIRAGEAIFSQQQSPDALKAPQAVMVIPYEPTKHEVDTVPTAATHQSGYSVLIYHTLLDGTQHDRGGRRINEAKTYFLMPNDKAEKFLERIEHSENGADMFENFVQKAAPDVMAQDSHSSGIRRAKAEGLFVLNPKLRQEIVPDDIFFDKQRLYPKIQALLKSQERVPVINYSQPVGVDNN